MNSYPPLFISACGRLIQLADVQSITVENTILMVETAAYNFSQEYDSEAEAEDAMKRLSAQLLGKGLIVAST